MRLLPILVLIISSTLIFNCTQSDLAKGEKLAKVHCAACHVFPEPNLLDKKTWENGALPEMAFRMSLDNSKMMSLSVEDLDAVIKSFPGNPVVTEEDFKLIKFYYRTHAPDSLRHLRSQKEPLIQFIPNIWTSGKLSPNISMVMNDTLSHTFWVGDRNANLFQYRYDLSLLTSFSLPSPLSSLLSSPKAEHIALTMGNMDPSDVYKGSLIKLLPDDKRKVLIDSLNRPTFFEVADLNNDGLDDYVICEFGNYLGGINAFQNLGDNTFKKIPLTNLPGGRKVVVKDFDNNGLLDIMALITQGDEQIQLFLNSGNLKFRVTIIKRFPPVYGSSYFELVDMNADGNPDIVYSNGDNADYSQTLKPYHGIRIFLNKGNFEFTEDWFFPMYGASQTISQDFDSDGDVDIAAVSFFPDFSKPEHGFLYLENMNEGEFNFKTYSTPLASSGRWLRMEKLDLDKDGDQDLLLGAMNFGDAVPAPLIEKWKKENAAILVLRNQLR